MGHTGYVFGQLTITWEEYTKPIPNYTVGLQAYYPATVHTDEELIIWEL